MRNAMRTVLLLSLALVLAVPVVAWAGGAPADAGPTRTATGPVAQPTEPANGGGASADDAATDADQLRTRDQLRDGTCEAADEAAESDSALNAVQTQTQARIRTNTQARVQARTQDQDGSCEATPTDDGVPDRDQLRDRDQFKDGSGEASATFLAAAAFADESSQALDRVQERETVVERIVESVPDGVVAWFRTMLRMFGLAS